MRALVVLAVPFALMVPGPSPAAELRAVVAARMIHRGDAITRDALSLVPVRSLPAPGFVSEPAEATGRIARRTIVRGRLIPRAALALPDEVKKGAPVTLEWRSGRLLLRVPATALASGRTGDTVIARVPATGKRVRARIAGPDRLLLGEDGR